MTWVKLDDQFYSHPKARAVGRDGRALYVAALCHASAHLTDGAITSASVPLLAAMAEVDPATADLLVTSGLWALSDDGYRIVGYEDHQRTRDDIDAAREAARERQARARAAKSHRTNAAVTPKSQHQR